LPRRHWTGCPHFFISFTGSFLAMIHFSNKYDRVAQKMFTFFAGKSTPPPCKKVLVTRRGFPAVELDLNYRGTNFICKIQSICRRALYGIFGLYWHRLLGCSEKR
jgi:hypothetical protein